MSRALVSFLASELRASTLRLAERRALAHQSNRLYDAWHGARHLIVKEFLIPDEMAEAPAREFGALERLTALDIAPQPVLYVPAGTVEGAGPLVVYEYMEGVMWDRGPRSAGDLAALAVGWQCMNGLPVEGLWLSRGQDRIGFRGYIERMRQHLDAYVAWAERDFPAGCDAAEHFATLVQNGLRAVDYLQAREPPLCFCRADPRFANVIVRHDGRIGFVDWEDSGLRDAACDVADLLLHANQEDLVTPELWKAFLDVYLPARRRVDSDLDERIECFQALFQLRWVAMLLKFGLVCAQNGSLTGWEINGRPPNWRLRRYLARGLAWPRSDFAAELEAVQAFSFFPGID